MTTTIPYNTKELTELDACPDPRLLLPEILKQLGQVSRLKICEAQRDAKAYTDEEINKLKSVVDTISNGLDADALDKLQKVNDLFNAIDSNNDGSLSELTNIVNNVNSNITDITNLKTQLTTLTTELTRLDSLENRVTILESDSHNHESSIRDAICLSNKHFVQAFNAGIDKFNFEMNKSCDIALNSSIPSSSSTSSSSSSSTSSSTTSSSVENTVSSDAAPADSPIL